MEKGAYAPLAVQVPYETSGSMTWRMIVCVGAFWSNLVVPHPTHTAIVPERFRAKASLMAGTPLTGAIALRYRAVHGRPDTEILRVAAEHAVDGIVVGTSGRQGLERMLLGSVAENVVRGAHCTVMVVKNPSAAPR